MPIIIKILYNVAKCTELNNIKFASLHDQALPLESMTGLIGKF